MLIGNKLDLTRTLTRTLTLTLTLLLTLTLTLTVLIGNKLDLRLEREVPFL